MIGTAIDELTRAGESTEAIRALTIGGRGHWIIGSERITAAHDLAHDARDHVRAATDRPGAGALASHTDRLSGIAAQLGWDTVPRVLGPSLLGPSTSGIARVRGLDVFADTIRAARGVAGA